MWSKKPSNDVVPLGSSRMGNALRELEAGTIELDEYLERHVDTAVYDVKRLGLVTDEQLNFLRELLRELITTDPVLVELVRRATGKDIST